MFAAEVGAAIRARRIPFGVDLEDLDDDGQVDLMVTGLDVDFFKIAGIFIQAMTTNSSTFDL